MWLNKDGGPEVGGRRVAARPRGDGPAERPHTGQESGLAASFVSMHTRTHTHINTYSLVRSQLYYNTGEDQHAIIARRYGLWRADGSVGVTFEDLYEDVQEAGRQGATLARENEGRIIVKVRPRRVRSWDFSRAPFARG